MDKDYILKEIRRTAEENGGTPLGWRRFFTETGIRETDWLGRYWARWSDALREAGFAPNQLTSAYRSDHLIQRYISLARKLRSLPTKADLRMESQSDPTFPNDKTFSRFGSKAEIVSKVREYCHSRQGYADIVELCDSYQARPRTLDRPGVKPIEGEIGFVYLMKSGRFYKVGRSNATGRRERELAIQLPERASTVHVIRTDDPPGIEAYWHRRFAAKRKNGEWFELAAADVSAFKRRTFM